jgi:CheY-like chemotaxis protein
MDKSIRKLADILLVEDNPGDVRLTKEALGESLINHVYVVYDGEEALDFLYQRGRYTKMPRPGLILLDLNLPKKDGRQVLREIRADEGLKDIPVVVMTSSQAHEDIVRAEELRVRCYITKPIDPDQFIETLLRSGDGFRVVSSDVPA